MFAWVILSAVYPRSVSPEIITKFPEDLIICNRRLVRLFRDKTGAAMRKAMRSLPGITLKISEDVASRIFISMREVVPNMVIVEEDIRCNNFCSRIDADSVN